jgi:hypothetical protein
MQGASHDIWSVNTDFEYHEEQRIEPPARKAPPSAPPGIRGGDLPRAAASVRVAAGR